MFGVIDFSSFATWVSIFVIIAFIVGLILLWKFGSKEIVKKIIAKLVTEAEAMFIGTKRGPEKYQYVLDRLFSSLPLVRFILNICEVDEWIDSEVEKIKAAGGLSMQTDETEPATETPVPAEVLTDDIK